MAIIDPNGLFLGDRLAKCSDEAQLHFVRLYCAANNYARMELNYQRILAKAYGTFKQPPTEKKFWQLIREFRDNFLLFVWQVNGAWWGQWQTNERYLLGHKNAEDRRSPVPPQSEQEEYRMRYVESKTQNHALADLSGVVLNHIDPHGLTVAGVGVGVGVGKELNAPSKLDAEAPPQNTFLELPTLREPFAVSDRDVASWEGLYPAVDVKQALRNMRGWLEATPKRRKTPQGMPRFIHNWLRSDQDGGRGPKTYTPPPAKPLRGVTLEEAMQR